jgi:hypothetical protein
MQQGCPSSGGDNAMFYAGSMTNSPVLTAGAGIGGLSVAIFHGFASHHLLMR